MSALTKGCICGILLLAQASTACAAEKMRTAFDSRGYLQAKFSKLSPAGKTLWKQILDAEDMASQPLGFDEITARMVGFQEQLSKDDFTNICGMISLAIDPEITRNDLKDVIQATRRALDTIQFEYVADTLSFDPAEFDLRTGQRPTQVVASFASHGAKIYLRETRRLNGSVLLEQANAFDGEVLRESVKYPSHTVTNSGISRLSSRIVFFPDAHPLRRTMLVDARRDLSLSDYNLDDLVEVVKSWIIFPGFSVVDGQRCVVVSNFSNTVYCASDMGYALVQSNLGGMRFDSSTGRYGRSGAYLLKKNSDFQQLASGVWLPRRLEYQRFFADGMPGEHTITTVGNYSTVAPPDDLFVKVIPDGAVVSDSVQKAVYTAGEDQSLPSKLSQASPQRSSANRYRLLLAINVLALVILLGLGLLYFRKNKPDATK